MRVCDPGKIDSHSLLRVRLDHLDGRVGVTLLGELDAANADEFARRLQQLGEQSSGDIVVDLSELTFIDSSGVRSLVQVDRALGPTRRLMLVRPSAPVRRIIELTGLEDMLALEATGGPSESLPLGAVVEVTRRRSYAPGGVMEIFPGDHGVIVDVGERAYAVDFGGVVAPLLHNDVVRVPPRSSL